MEKVVGTAMLMRDESGEGNGLNVREACMRDLRRCCVGVRRYVLTKDWKRIARRGISRIRVWA